MEGGLDHASEIASERVAMQRLLIVAAAEATGPDVREAVAERIRGGVSEIRIVAPSLTESVLERTMGDVDDAIAAAQGRLDRVLEEIRGLEGLGEPEAITSGAVGDTDVRLAIQDALQTFDADEILIVAHEDDPFAQEHEGIADAQKSFEPPMTLLYVTQEPGAEPSVAEVEKVDRGVQEVDPGEIDPSKNLPPLGVRDMAGVTVAILGTGLLIVLAATCGLGDRQGFDGCAARALLAGAFLLINIAHIVGLTLFQAGPYRGFWRDFFANTSLVGTPAAVLVSAVFLG
jgi:hypothetical protein